MAEPVSIDAPPAKSWKTGLRAQLQQLRLPSAWAGECTLAEAAAGSSKFFRATELSECDAAIIVGQNTENLPLNSTDRLFEQMRRYRNTKCAVHIEFKTVTWKPLPDDRSPFHLYRTQLALTGPQARDVQVIVVGFLSEPEWVAVIPRPYLNLQDVPEDRVHIVLGQRVPSIVTQNCAIPVRMMPFAMPLSYLPRALEDIAQRASGTSEGLSNPYTGIDYKRCRDWKPRVAPFNTVMPAPDSADFWLKERLWRAFSQSNDSGGLQARIPSFTPLNCDIRLDHTNGTSVFIEIKQNAMRLMKLDDGSIRLSCSPYTHASRTNPGTSIYKFSQAADYIFHVHENHDFGWLIKKDDFPDHFWHTSQTNKRLIQDYPDKDHFEQYVVRLNRGLAAIVSDIRRVVAPNGVPLKSNLTGKAIIDRYGLLPSLSTTDENFENSDAEEDEVEVWKDTLGQPKEDNGNTGKTLVRLEMKGGQNKVTIAFFCDLLMRQCRRTGRGCAVYLGASHPAGNIAFMHYVWSDQEKLNYDRTGAPPRPWYEASKDTTVVMLTVLWTPWLTSEGPIEDSHGQSEFIAKSHPSLVICHAMHAHHVEHQKSVWLVPSGLFPKTHVGALKSMKANRVGAGLHAPIFLENQQAVPSFMVELSRLTETMNKIFTAGDTFGIGLSPEDPRNQIEVAKYFKTIGEIRKLTEEHFDEIRDR